jgi:hypothetical protein
MAACKCTKDATGTVTVAAAALPVSCKLQNPPSGVTISEAELFPAGGGNPINYPITSGKSFNIPKPPQGTSGNLFVRIIGNYPAGTTIYVVEDCDSQTRILAITDRLAKYAYAPLEVD